MTDPHLSELSALVDGELTDDQGLALYAALGRDPRLRAAWERYHLIGQSLRREPLNPAARGLAEAVRARIGPECVRAGVQPRPPGGRSWRAPFAGAALAAGAALLTVLVVPGGLPLRSDVSADRGAPRALLLFTSLELGVSPAASAAGETAERTANRTHDQPGPPSTPARTRWRFEGRAPGFELALYDRLEDGQGRPVEHYLFSDRLSSYSVYIEEGAGEGLDGATRIGAVHAAGRIIGGHRVTAVGEVPAATVEAALAGVHPESIDP